MLKLWSYSFSQREPEMGIVRRVLCGAWFLALTFGLSLGAWAQQGQTTKKPIRLAQVGSNTGSRLKVVTPPALHNAEVLLSQGKFSQAEGQARSYLQDHNKSAQAHFLLGYILFREIQARALKNNAMVDNAPAAKKFRRSHARESLKQFTAGAKYSNPTAFDIKIVAYDYVLLNDFSDADKWMTKSVKMDPSDAEAWYSLGRIKYNENRFGEAIHAFHECLQRDGHNVRAENNLGLSYEGLGRVNAAIKAYKTAIGWEPVGGANNAGPFLNLGKIYIEKSRPGDALPFLVDAARISPKNAKVHESLGKAYSLLNKLPEAQAQFEKAVGLAPANSSFHYLLGQVYRKEGLLKKANLEFKRTAELNGAHSSRPIPPM